MTAMKPLAWGARPGPRDGEPLALIKMGCPQIPGTCRRARVLITGVTYFQLEEPQWAESSQAARHLSLL